MPKLKYLTAAQRGSYQHDSYLHLPGIYSPQQVEDMRSGLAVCLRDWAQTGQGWQRPGDTAEKRQEQSQLQIMQGLEYYHEAWERARFNPKLLDAAQDLLGPNVEYFGSSTHSKPARTGGSFPMHQDSYFYGHETDAVLICMVHLDETHEQNGPISFIPGSLHRHIPHVVESDPVNGGPYLDPGKYRIDDAIPVYCQPGDVVIFNVFTIHGSRPNLSDHDRRAVVFRYRDPQNKQIRKGKRPFDYETDYAYGTMVRGSRPPIPGCKAPSGGIITRPRKVKEMAAAK